MIFRMEFPYLVTRTTKDGTKVFQYRREVSPALRSLVGKRELIESLRTTEPETARARWKLAHERAERILKEAEAGRKSPEIAGYKAVDAWRSVVTSPENEEALDYHLTSLLEDGGSIPRETVEALLKRHEDGAADNPPLSIIFERYYAERKLPAKTRLEWDLCLDRMKAACGGDLPVRSLTQAHVRMLKDRLLSTPRRGGEGGTLSPATVKKNLSGLKAVLSWAQSNGYITHNPAEKMTVATAKNLDDTGRIPYSADDLRVIFAEGQRTIGATYFSTRTYTGADYWLPWLGLYTGARLEELGQLRTADVRHEEGVDYLAIEPGDGKRVKTRSSKRRVPVHPELIKLGFLDFVSAQRVAGRVRLFPELKATRFALTSAWSKWWGRHVRQSCGITDPRKTFHSFRHGWKEAARAAMTEEVHDAITGHSNGSVGRSYGSMPLKVMFESIARVRFEGVGQWPRD